MFDKFMEYVVRAVDWVLAFSIPEPWGGFLAGCLFSFLIWFLAYCYFGGLCRKCQKRFPFEYPTDGQGTSWSEWSKMTDEQRKTDLPDPPWWVVVSFMLICIAGSIWLATR